MVLLAILAATASTSSARPERFSYKGKTYQAVDIIDVKGTDVTLLTDKEEQISVPIRFLSFKLRDKAAEFVKAKNAAAMTIDGIASEDAKNLQLSLIQAAQEGTAIKRWIAGTVSNESVEGGVLIFSATTALPAKFDRKGNPLPQKRVKNSAIFIEGVVLLDGIRRHAPNTLVEYFAWDTGERVEIKSQLVPRLTLKPQDPKVLFEERSWTNTEGKTLIAALLAIKKETGQFRRADGSRFAYPISNLAATDQQLIEKAVQERIKKLKSTL
ncbi:MAG: hypothetical protein VCA55_06000 [Verrucomicrobiales bacterium]